MSFGHDLPKPAFFRFIIPGTEKTPIGRVTQIAAKCKLIMLNIILYYIILQRTY